MKLSWVRNPRPPGSWLCRGLNSPLMICSLSRGFLTRYRYRTRRVWFLVRLRTATEAKALLKMWFRVLSPIFIVIIPTHVLTWSKVGKLSWSWSSQKERKFRHGLFTSSIKRKIKHLQVVVVQGRQRNVKKKGDARADLLLCKSNLLTNTENTITYHNTLCWSLQNFA